MNSSSIETPTPLGDIYGTRQEPVYKDYIYVQYIYAVDSCYYNTVAIKEVYRSRLSTGPVYILTIWHWIFKWCHRNQFNITTECLINVGVLYMYSIGQYL